MTSESALARPRSVDKNGAHLQGRLLANWEEFKEFRKEALSRLEELFELSQRVRKSEKTAQIHAGQLDVRVDRCLQKMQDVQNRYESNENKFQTLAKAVEGAKESLDASKKKQQQHAAEQQAALDTMKRDLIEQNDKQQRALQEAIRRGDRSVADEILRKMAELNEKLGANMQSLEEEVAVDLQQMSVQVADLTSREREDREAISVAVESLESFVQNSVTSMKDEFSGRLNDAQAQLSDVVRNATSAARESRDHHQQLQALEARVQDGFAAAQQSLSAWKEAESASTESLRTQIQEVSKEARDDTQRTQDSLNSKIRELSSNLQSDLSSGLSKCKDQVDSLNDDFQAGIEETRQQVRTVCQEMFQMVSEVHQRIQSCESSVSDLQHQTKESEKKLQEDASRSDQRFKGFEDWTKVRLEEISKQMQDLELLTRQTTSENKKQCREWVDEALQLQEQASSMHGKALDKARSDITLDMQEVRLSFEEQLHSTSSRTEVLVKEARKEAESLANDACQRVDDLASRCLDKWAEAERLASVQKNQKQLCDDLEKRTSALELQVSESVAQLREKLGEALGSCRASQRAEEDLESQCEKLQRASTDLGNAVEELKCRTAQGVEKFQELRSELRTEFFEKEQHGKQAVEDVRRQLQQRIDNVISEASTKIYGQIDKGHDAAVKAAREAKDHCNAQIQELHDIVGAQSSEWRKQLEMTMGDTHRSLVMLRDVQWQVERDLRDAKEIGEKYRDDHLGSSSKVSTQTGNRSLLYDPSWRPRSEHVSLSDGTDAHHINIGQFDPEASETRGLFQEMVKIIADVYKQISQIREESGLSVKTLQKRLVDSANLDDEIDKLRRQHEHFAHEIREELHGAAGRLAKECKADCRRTYREVVDEAHADHVQSLSGMRDDLRTELLEKYSETHLFCEKATEEAKRMCREWIDETLKFQESSQRAQDRVREENNSLSQSAVMALEDRLQAGVSKNEALALETQRQTRLWADETARQVEDLAVKVKDKCAELGRDTRRLHDQYQEMRQEIEANHAGVERQVAESVVQLRDKVGETIASCKASKRAEADLEARCDKLQKVEMDLTASVQDLRQKVSGVTSKVQESAGELRSELRSDVLEVEKREKHVLDEAQRHWQVRLDASLSDMSSRLGSRIDRIQEASTDISRDFSNLRKEVEAQTKDLRWEVTQKIAEVHHGHAVQATLRSTRSPRADIPHDHDFKSSHAFEPSSRPHSPRDTARHRMEAPWRLGPEVMTHHDF